MAGRRQYQSSVVHRPLSFVFRLSSSEIDRLRSTLIVHRPSGRILPIVKPQPLTLEQLLVFVERAARGDRRLLVSLFRQFQQLARLPQAPPEERARVRSCHAVMGEAQT
jgi:hypothetical protein